MRRSVRRRFWLEAAAAVITAMLTLTTLISREWIEVVFGVDPDNHSGSLEWAIVAVSFVVTASLVAAARYEWRIAAPSPEV